MHKEMDAYRKEETERKNLAKWNEVKYVPGPVPDSEGALLQELRKQVPKLTIAMFGYSHNHNTNALRRDVQLTPVYPSPTDQAKRRKKGNGKLWKPGLIRRLPEVLAPTAFHRTKMTALAMAPATLVHRPVPPLRLRRRIPPVASSRMCHHMPKG